MAKTKLYKGSETIFVTADAVTAHEALGWRQTPEAALVAGELSLGGVAVSVEATRLNELNYNAPDAGTLENQAVRHYQTAPTAASATGIHAAVTLGAAAQDVASGITDPDVPRTVTVKGNVSGITGDVVITGPNIDDEVISDTIALNGTNEVEGVKAFKAVTRINFPAQTHTPTAQVETATVVGTVSGDGNAAVVVTVAGMTGSPKTINVAVLTDDTPAVVAGKIRTALGEDAAVIALFDVGGVDATVVLTRKIPAANDATLNISIDNGTCAGLTTAATSANTTAGVGYDTVSVGQASKFGLPHIVDYASCLLLALFNGSADTGGSLAVDADEVEKNLYSIAGTPNGSKKLDLYYLA
jgi:hypothetical protein